MNCIGLKRIIVGSLLTLLLLLSCNKEEIVYLDNIQTIPIINGITVDNYFNMKDPTFNGKTYEKFLKYLSSSDHFLIVKHKDFNRSFSSDKVILTIRHDIDDDINSAVKFAYLENKYGIETSYFFLHTADYYGKTTEGNFRRRFELLYYMRKIQDVYEHEIGLHNDLITLQLLYNINPKNFLMDELEWLRRGRIKIYGSTSHGSEYCDIFNYVNAYFWLHFKNGEGRYYNYETINKHGQTVKIEKDSLSRYNLDYEGDTKTWDYFFADSDRYKGKRWNMSMVNFDTIPAGKKIIILIHPQHWN